MTDIEPKIFETWIAHLEHELASHRDLLAAADAKSVCLIDRNPSQLGALVSREEGVLDILKQLRIRRQRLRMLTAKALNTPPDDLRLKDVVREADEPARERLQELEGHITEVVRRLQRVNERNSMLQRTGLALVSDVLRTIAGGQKAGVPTYNRGGRAVEEPQGRGNLCSFQA